MYANRQAGKSLEWQVYPVKILYPMSSLRKSYADTEPFPIRCRAYAYPIPSDCRAIINSDDN